MRERRTEIELLEALHGGDLEPGLDDEEIDALDLPGPVPADVRALLRRTACLGSSGAPVHRFGHGDLFPRAVTIDDDGAGNEWVCDVASDGSWGRIYFASHDPPDVTLAAESLRDFLEAALRGELATDATPIAPVIDPARSEDPVIRELAARVGTDHDVLDLRSASIGDGFSWGAAGANARIVRAGDPAVWAVERPRPGLFARWFGRR